MEPRFGQDFSNVRVHTNDDAARSARDVNALAYTAGQNIAFGSGQYTPSTSRGQRLIAHELAHVVQQRRAPAPDTDSISKPGDRDEIAADRTSAAALEGRAPEPAAGAAGADHALQRDPPPPGSLQQRSLPPDAGPAKLPEKPKGSDEAIAEALKKAYDDFSKTQLGKELEEHAKSYVLSVKGLPFDIFVVQGVAMIISTFDPKLPNVPDIDLGDGITLKIEYTGRASDLPPLMRQLVTGHHDPARPIERDKAGQPTNETKLAVSGNFTFWFDLKDTEGFQNREAVHYDVRGFRDEAPRVVIDEPKTDLPQVQPMGILAKPAYFRRRAIAVKDDRHLLTVCRYVERNPVKAQLAARAADWPWSSARFRDAYVQLGVLPELGGSIAWLNWKRPDGRTVPLLRQSDAVAIDSGNPSNLACFPLVPFANRIAGTRSPCGCGCGLSNRASGQLGRPRPRPSSQGKRPPGRCPRERCPRAICRTGT
jgi:hypothetical protein